MSRMLEALKQLEGRHRAVSPVRPPIEDSFEAGPFFLNSGTSEFDPYQSSIQAPFPTVEQYLHSPPVHSSGLSTPVDEPHVVVDRARAVLDLQFTGDEYETFAARLAELVGGDARHCILVYSVSTDTDDALSLPTLGRCVAERLGRRLLLVHTNRRLRSVLHAVPPAPLSGLTECLFEGLPWAAAVNRTSHPMLDFIPRGQSAFRGGPIAELQFPGAWQSEYGSILIGAAPHSQQLALDLAVAADATILAVKLGSIDRQGLERVATSFRAVGARLAGCLVLD